MRILKTLMLLAGVTVFMPSPPEDKALIGEQQQAAAEVSTPAIIGSATMAFADVVSFCSRQAQVCETAGYVAHKLEAKAKYGVRLIYEWASESSTDPAIAPAAIEADASDPIETGSTRLAAASPVIKDGQSTLRIEDLIPPWRGPGAQKKS